jgi:hypothetical protein
MDVRLTDEGDTLVSGMVVDQAALQGLLAKVRDLGLVLISVQRAVTGNAGQLDLKKE